MTSLDNNIEQLIRQHVVFSRKAATGFEQLKCAPCNDYKVRAGFHFENGKIRYHCFNCSLDTTYNESFKDMPEKFRHVLNSFNMDDESINNVLAKKFFNPTKLIHQPKVKSAFALPGPIHLPAESYKLSDAPDDDPWKQVATEYIASRGLSIDSYPWYLSAVKRYRSTFIIPYFRQGQIIYWQARQMDDFAEGSRYDNPAISRTNILFNFDELFRYTDEPLFVTEGALDAISIGKNCICLAGSTLNEFKVEMLNRVKNREIIFVIDKDKNGQSLGRSVVTHGWTITFFDGELKDANDALVKMGKLWMLNHLMENRKTNFGAAVWLNSIKIEDKEHA
jgi:hypothetical protein